jgi:ABC-type nitrate/sulfonate/bicarbonate transport system permease component
MSVSNQRPVVDAPARKPSTVPPTWTSSLLSGITRRRVMEDRSKPLSRRSRIIYGTVAIVVVLGGWQLLSSTHSVNTLLVSSPSDIVKAAYDLNNSGVLGSAVWQTTKVFFIAFGLSLIVGIALGIVIGWYRRLGALLDPIVSMLYAAPRVALLPLIVAWTGIGDEAQIVTVLTIAVFPILVNVQAGVGTVDRNLVQVARTYLGSNFDVLRTIALPACVPHLVSGVRQGLAQALLGVVIAEYLIGSTGIGGLIVSAGQTLNFSNAFVGVFVVSFAALLLTSALRWVERRLDHWRV